MKGVEKVPWAGSHEAEKSCGIVIAMATIDKTSVRDEVNRLKSEFEQLCSEGKVSSEIRVLMSSLLVVVDLILSIFLEKKTRKNSKNSSLPPSQTSTDETSLSKTVSNGKGKKVSGRDGNSRTIEGQRLPRQPHVILVGPHWTTLPARGMNDGRKLILFSRKSLNISMLK